MFYDSLFKSPSSPSAYPANYRTFVVTSSLKLNWFKLKIYTAKHKFSFIMQKLLSRPCVLTTSPRGWIWQRSVKACRTTIAEVKFQDSKFLSNKFKHQYEYVVMENEATACKVDWGAKAAKNATLAKILNSWVMTIGTLLVVPLGLQMEATP